MPSKKKPDLQYNDVYHTNIALILVLAIAVCIGYWLGGHDGLQKRLHEWNPLPPTEKACTMEALMCPDGTAVGRMGPNCEFAPCPDRPTPTPTIATPLTTVNDRCVDDTDCTMINKDLGFGCCYAGLCEATDYREDKWAAVNDEWFTSERDVSCVDSCGAPPLCDVMAVNIDYQAACVSGRCKKIPY